MNWGIVLANGCGSRFGSPLPKQFHKLGSKLVIDYSIEALLNSKTIDKIIVMAEQQYEPLLKKDSKIVYIEGGDTRNKTLKKALKFIDNTDSCKRIIILEAARPMITCSIVDQYIELLDDYDAVITGQKIVDSLGCYSKYQVDREDYYLIQAPEAFRFKVLYDNFDEDSKITATNQQLPPNSKLFINFQFKNNYKLTYSADLKLCEQYLRP